MAELMIAGAFLSGALNVLFDRLASRPVVDFLWRQKSFDRHLLDKLKTKLLDSVLVLNDAEEKQFTNTHVREWIVEFKNVEYVVEDLLDNINTVALLEVESDSKRGAWSIGTKWNKMEQKMEQNIREVLGQLENLSQKKDVLGLKKERLLTSSFVEGSSSQRLPTSSFVDEYFVSGRDVDKERIIESVLSDDHVERGLGVVTIVGMGGLGKTTLAQLVYNDTKVEEWFQMRVWVFVSEYFDVISVTKKILAAVTGSSCDSNDLNWLQVRLEEGLRGKKFLMILDDVWNENYDNWLSLQNPLRSGAKGSKIIVTTRLKNVASIMGRGTPQYDLKELLDEDAWALFAKHAFDNNHPSNRQELEVIGKRIIKKCKGLPLACKTLGGLLRSKSDVDEWNNILNSELWELPSETSNTLSALSVSYHYLPPHVKRCFAYCAIFPKGYEFEKEDIILWWMAEGFLHSPNGKKQMEEVGNDILSALVSACFFQQSNWRVSRLGMHDLINDLAKYVCGEFCVRSEGDESCEGFQKTRYFSYLPNKRIPNSRKVEAIMCAKALRSFISLGQPYDNDYIPPPWDILRSQTCLRVLSLYGSRKMEELPDIFGDLIHLRYLNVSFTNIRRLPDSITGLCYLQTLLMSDCSLLTELPANMEKLINLRHFDFRRSGVKEMPMHMSKLSKLRSLSYFRVGEEKMKELKDLNELRGSLNILNLQNVTSGREAQEGNMKDKVHIEELEFEWSGGIGDSEIARDVLEKLEPHTKVKRLTINGFEGTRFPDWLGDESFSHMTYLRLESCKYCQSLPPLGQLPSLKHLYITGFDEVVRVGGEFYGKSDSFMCLQTLSFWGMPQLEEWVCLANFPCLQYLRISNCPKLKGHLPFPMSDLPITLKTLRIDNCPSLELGLVEHDDDDDCYPTSSLEKVIIIKNDSVKSIPLSLFPNDEMQLNKCMNLKSLWTPKGFHGKNLMKSLQIEECKNLKSLPERMHDLLPSLQELTIIDCDELESFTGLPSSLRNLVIRSCPKLMSRRMEWGLEKLPNLRSLVIGGVEGESFPEEGFLPSSLQSLEIECFPNLKCLNQRPLQQLVSLKSINASNCPELSCLPEEGSFTFGYDNCPLLPHTRGGTNHLFRSMFLSTYFQSNLRLYGLIE